MFKQNFINICIERGIAPTVVLKNIGISHATFSNWNDDSIPRPTTITKIANYFGITPEDLLREPKEKVSTVPVEPAASSPLSTKFNDLLGQMTLQDLIELQQIMEEKIKNRK
jgi:transcriptional regulator with XRE-family HTH domain